MDDMDKPSIELENHSSDRPSTPRRACDDDEDESTEQPVEVTFESSSSARRKSSINHIPHRLQRPGTGRRRTSMAVHGFLEDSRLRAEHAIDNEENSTARRSSPIDKKKADSDIGDHNKHDQGHDHGLTAVLSEPDLQSRLLTKKELSDMAFGIRELSKRLSHFKLRLKVHNIFLLTKAHDETLIEKTRHVAAWLLSKDSGAPHTVYVEDTLQDNKNFGADSLAKKADKGSKLAFWSSHQCKLDPNKFDIVLALGGDGTVLYASWLFQRIVPPVLSFALGSLGFLTKFDFESYRDTLTQAFDEGLTVSVRLRLEATVMRAQKREGDEQQKRDLVEELIGEEAEDEHTHTPEQSFNILNDVVMDRGPNPTMSSIEVFGDNFHITTVQADGVCVATPTGSTAYNLAAGGSLCHPDNPVILVTAICAHTLSFRPILLPDTMVLRVGVPYDARTNPWVSFDGKERLELGPGDYVTISASRFPFPTVLPLGRGSEDWIDSLSRTLNWNSRQRQKAFSKD